MLTIERIAAIANVSRSTVSRVINNSPDVSEETRARVKQVIEQINYQPNMAARRLAGGHIGIIGLVVPTGVSMLFTDPFFSIIIQGVSTACNAMNHNVMLWLAEPEYERRMMRQLIHNRFIDGAIIASTLINDPLLHTMIEADLPFVLIGRAIGVDNVTYVDVDNFTASLQMVEHLIDTGYRRIATITGPMDSIAGHDRLEGYKAGLMKFGLPVEENLIEHADFTERGGYTAMQRLLPRCPQTVFVASDTMCTGAMRAIKEAGLRVPEDIGIAGFDDMPFSATADPPLTTVHQPIYESGAVAARTLVDKIDHPETPHRQIILPTNLVIRSSCRLLHENP